MWYLLFEDHDQPCMVTVCLDDCLVIFFDWDLAQLAFFAIVQLFW